MDRPTVEVYERRIDDYLRRRLGPSDAAMAFGGTVPAGRLRLDLGSGPGHMTGALGSPVVAVHAAWSMISRVDGHLAAGAGGPRALPFRAGGPPRDVASKCLQHAAGRAPAGGAGDLDLRGRRRPLASWSRRGRAPHRARTARDLPARRPACRRCRQRRGRCRLHRRGPAGRHPRRRRHRVARAQRPVAGRWPTP